MSTRWMMVQYIGNTLRLPVVNESDMGKPFGSSALERDVRRIVVNPFSDSPQVFVPEAENAKLREERDMYRDLVGMMDHPDLNAQLQAENDKLREQVDYMTPIALYEASEQERDRMRELGIEVD